MKEAAPIDPGLETGADTPRQRRRHEVHLPATRRGRLRLAWDAFMVVLAIVNVALIVFDWTYLWVRPFYVEHAPALARAYDPVKGIGPAAGAETAPPLDYVRERREDGEPVDLFWLVDLPFLLVFAVEFFARWAVAVKRRTYPRWFIFPIVHWYDLLGIVPSREFRVFRLFRLVSIYVRLSRSELTSVGRDPFSRGVRWLADVVTEEVSDRVAMKILDQAEREIRSGAVTGIVRGVFEPRRREVRERVAARVAEIVGSPHLRERLRSFLRVNLDQSIESSALRSIPLPNAVLRPLVHTVGEVVFDSVVDTLADSLASPAGRESLEEIVDGVMETFHTELGRGEIEELLESTALGVIADMRAAIAVRRWAQPEPAAEPAEAVASAERRAAAAVVPAPRSARPPEPSPRPGAPPDTGHPLEPPTGEGGVPASTEPTAPAVPSAAEPEPRSSDPADRREYPL